MKNMICLALVLFFGGQLMAQYSVSGILKDQADGAALVGAHVSLVNEADGSEQSVITNERGLFRIKDLVPGTYELTITYLGYAPIQQKVQVENSNLQLRITNFTN